MDQLPAYPYRADGWTALGFADVFTLRTPDGRVLLAHLRWCTFADLLLTPATAEIDGPRGLGVALTFATISADDVAERARAAGATILEGPVDRPWNTRDVTIADLDGFRLTFTAPQRAVLEGRSPSFDSVMARARDAANREARRDSGSG